VKKLTVQKMHDDLDYWIHIGIADDIVNLPAHRPEYQHLVKKLMPYKALAEEIPKLVLKELKYELCSHWIFRPTFYVILWFKLKGILKI